MGPLNVAQTSCIIDRATCWVMSRDSERQSSGCASRGLVEGQRREVKGALTHYLEPPPPIHPPTFARACDSHGQGMT